MLLDATDALCMEEFSASNRDEKKDAESDPRAMLLRRSTTSPSLPPSFLAGVLLLFSSPLCFPPSSPSSFRAGALLLLSPPSCSSSLPKKFISSPPESCSISSSSVTSSPARNDAAPSEIAIAHFRSAIISFHSTVAPQQGHGPSVGIKALGLALLDSNRISDRHSMWLGTWQPRQRTGTSTGERVREQMEQTTNGLVTCVTSTSPADSLSLSLPLLHSKFSLSESLPHPLPLSPILCCILCFCRFC
mmetsp:Transcript_52253/g.156817  ORF Transcript_52253/g.156817 Transcript_52253/m.156817 type:complete len:247 (-) Transcript_52253:359-1099(-)